MFETEQIQQSLNHERRNFAKLSSEHSSQSNTLKVENIIQCFKQMQCQYGNRALLDSPLLFLISPFLANLQFSTFLLPLRLVCLLHFTDSSWSSCVLNRSSENLSTYWIESMFSMSTEHSLLSTGEKCEFYVYDCLVALRIAICDPFTIAHNT